MRKVEKCILVIGDPVCGFSFVGPFATILEANKYANDHVLDTWCIADVWEPAEFLEEEDAA